MNHYQLLLRHPQLLDNNTLIIGAGAELPPQWHSLVQQKSVSILTWEWQTAQAYTPLSEPQVTFSLPDSALLTQAKEVILLWPKSKPLALAIIKKIAEQHKHCWVVGANDTGGRSIHKATQSLTLSANKEDSARHCSLWRLKLKEQQAFNWLTLAKAFDYQNQTYLTLPGVFNHGNLDKGTALLLENLPAPRTGRLLDLGCGSGVIGLSMKAEENNLEVTLADVDAFALQSARLNCARLGLEAEVLASDGLAQINGKYDFIITNPPFHQGKETNYNFARQLFSQAKSHLVHDGQIWLVANRHLAYEDWAKEHFSHVEVMTQQDGFKLLCIHN